MYIGVTNKTQYLQRSWALPNDSKHTEASFSAIFTDKLTLHLRVAQMPRSPDLAIFVLTTNRRQINITPCACVRGKKIEIRVLLVEGGRVQNQPGMIMRV